MQHFPPHMTPFFIIIAELSPESEAVSSEKTNKYTRYGFLQILWQENMTILTK